MDFHSELVAITEFRPFEEFLVKKKASELYKECSSNKITVAVNPSNLVELTRVGERFAPDSCGDCFALKYVVSDELIPNKETATRLVRKEEKPQCNFYSQERANVESIIPGLIVRQRPGISYKSLKDPIYTMPVRSEQALPVSQPTENQRKIATISKTQSNKKLLETEPKKPKLIQSKTVKVPTIRRKSPKKSGKGKKKVKTILKKKTSETKEENISNSSASEKKTVTWEEVGNDDEITKEHEAKRKEHLERYKYQVPSYLKDKEKDLNNHEERLNELEKIVEEEKEFLNEKGIYTPGSSQASKYQKTYDELEKEIKSIKDMLSEDNRKQSDPKEHDEKSDDDKQEVYEDDEEEEDYYEEEEAEEGGSVEYSVSSDDAKIDDDKWMKPRFK